MNTVLSHIVQKRLSMEQENITTEALNYMINSSESAHKGIMKLLNGIAPELPTLRFQTQQAEKNVIPDMRKLYDSETRVYIENKFWAGLTENQPVKYLELLAKYSPPTILLVVVPDARQETMWRELMQRMVAANISYVDQTSSNNIYRVVEIGKGRFLALTSWHNLLSTIEVELTDEPLTRNDLLQIRSLCVAADNDAFIPFSAEELTNQRYPALLFNLNSIVQTVVSHGVTEGFLSIKGVTPSHTWEHTGRYFSFLDDGIIVCGAWLGTHFRFWKEYGGTPLWLTFSSTYWGRSKEVSPILEVWAKKNDIFTIMKDNNYVIAIDLITGEEKDTVIKAVLERLRDISEHLSVLPKSHA